uniref:Uncharacterized protein n=1 Tax=Odontella aurita TaxID=265563 RepID=A0A7S4MVV0_9STRA|mmetsp:Transcript_34220/g.102411  ORF Transcript_34220/g.102411 Transcript_34220/m.102411 type:complete len:288 (+) Transcript_34220:32-895(+)
MEGGAKCQRATKIITVSTESMLLRGSRFPTSPLWFVIVVSLSTTAAVECGDDSDCLAFTRGCGVGDVALCDCESRHNNDTFDSCAGETTENPCKCARCASDPCQGSVAYCNNGVCELRSTAEYKHAEFLTGPCTIDGDCMLERNYCGGCECIGILTGTSLPQCPPDKAQVKCFADPCSFGQSVGCTQGNCSILTPTDVNASAPTATPISNLDPTTVNNPKSMMPSALPTQMSVSALVGVESDNSTAVPTAHPSSHPSESAGRKCQANAFTFYFITLVAAVCMHQKSL